MHDGSFKLNEMNIVNYEVPKTKPKNLLKPQSLVGSSKIKVKAYDRAQI